MTGPLFAIGAPGRAALEVPPGLLPARIGPADVETSAACLPGVIVLAASCRGLQHQATAKLRQDAFALGRRVRAGEPDQLIAVVCDGVGSLGRSDEAAVLASRRLATLGAQGQLWPDAFAQVNAELGKLAAEAGAVGQAATPDDGMATTAVAIAVHRTEREWVAEAAWVGDSTLWHLDRGGRWTQLTGCLEEDADAGYHSTSVRPLPTVDGTCLSDGFHLEGGALFVMSDGVANPLRWSRDVQQTLGACWRTPPDPLAFAAQVRFARKTHIDDRTVIGIWPDGGEADAGR